MRVEEMRRERGPYMQVDAAAHYHRCLMGESTDHMLERRQPERKRTHNLKHLTWIEQQRKSLSE